MNCDLSIMGQDNLSYPNVWVDINPQPKYCAQSSRLTHLTSPKGWELLRWSR